MMREAIRVSAPLGGEARLDSATAGRRALSARRGAALHSAVRACGVRACVRGALCSRAHP